MPLDSVHTRNRFILTFEANQANSISAQLNTLAPNIFEQGTFSPSLKIPHQHHLAVISFISLPSEFFVLMMSNVPCIEPHYCNYFYTTILRIVITVVILQAYVITDNHQFSHFLTEKAAQILSSWGIPRAGEQHPWEPQHPGWETLAYYNFKVGRQTLLKC